MSGPAGAASGGEVSGNRFTRNREVGPRDGFQKEPEVIPTVFEIAERLVAAGATTQLHNTRGPGLANVFAALQAGSSHMLLAGPVDGHR